MNYTRTQVLLVAAVAAAVMLAFCAGLSLATKRGPITVHVPCERTAPDVMQVGS